LLKYRNRPTISLMKLESIFKKESPIFSNSL
jgi:hypothetical protein